MHQFPLATYRLQFNRTFTFQETTPLIEYLNQLGISHLYASPLMTSKIGSMHGYDIVNHSQLNPEIGSQQEFEAFIQSLHDRHMGLILDIVPNHMYIGDLRNKWWGSILENGQASIFADYFDIDWHPLRSIFDNKILLPLLDEPFGNALENQKLKIEYREGAFVITLYESSLPTDPKSWELILGALAQEIQKILSSEDPLFLELKSILTAIHCLPKNIETDVEKKEERLREKEIIKRRLRTLFDSHSNIYDLLSGQLNIFNGIKNQPQSFNLLEHFLNLQAYRLCYWRVANDEINFRRFFDIIHYTGLRVEVPKVFQESHAFIFDLVKKNLIAGLRIDHIDGLWDPKQYLTDLQAQIPPEKPLYVIAEKILTGEEKLLTDWPLQGTVGYDFLHALNDIFVYRHNKQALFEIYEDFTGLKIDYPRLQYACKKLVLETSLSSELKLLLRRLSHISEEHRNSQDFTTDNLKDALRDIIACFPVYRSYIRANEGVIHEEDRQNIHFAVEKAKQKNAGSDHAIFDYIQSLLLLDYPSDLDDHQKARRKDFVMHFQQLTGPVMAKGIEDTAFYRIYPLSSLNEVGSEPQNFGMDVDQFHKKNLEKWEFWPSSMLASTTHDTKRSEDVRARINILSEIPNEWQEALQRWKHNNQSCRSNDTTPDRNEEYLLYQTLIGTWPLLPFNQGEEITYLQRIQDYMDKAAKEAKMQTNWINPNRIHEESLKQFIANILKNPPFLQDFVPFAARISSLGMLNSLSQTLLKLTSPGVPDIYQGCEIWNFRLVDPDNRHPVDYGLRKKLLLKLKEENLETILQTAESGAIKLLIIKKTLDFRYQHRELFSSGTYIPLKIKGDLSQHLIAYARVKDREVAIVVATRYFSFLFRNFKDSLQTEIWKNNSIELPVELASCKFTHIFTDKMISSENGLLDLQSILPPLCVALLANTTT